MSTSSSSPPMSSSSSSSSSSSFSAASVVSKLTELLSSTEDDRYPPQSTLIMKHSIIYAITLQDWSECIDVRDLSKEWELISKKRYAVVKKIILDEVITYCEHLQPQNNPPKFFPKTFNDLDDPTIFYLVLECIRYCCSSLVKGRGLCSEFDILVDTLTILLARLPNLQTNANANVTTDYQDLFNQIGVGVDQSLIDTFVRQVDLVKCFRPSYQTLVFINLRDMVVEKLIKLLRSEEDNSFMPQNTKNTLDDWCEWDKVSVVWNLISQEKYLGVGKKIILDEVIAYCKHLRRCSFNKNQPLFHDDPDFFPRSLNHLDDQFIFDLIAECIRYCYSSVVKGRGLCPEFNILVNTLTSLAKVRNLQTNIRFNFMDAEAKRFPFEGFFGPQSLIDTLVSRTDSYHAYVEQVKLENCRQPIYDLDEGMTMNLEEQRKVRDLDPNNLELLDFPGRRKEKTNKNYGKYLRSSKSEGEGGNHDSDHCLHNEGAYAGLEPCPNPELVNCLDRLGRCKEKTVDPSCKVFPKAARITAVSSYIWGSCEGPMKLAMLPCRGKRIGTSLESRKVVLTKQKLASKK